MMDYPQWGLIQGHMIFLNFLNNWQYRKRYDKTLSPNRNWYIGAYVVYPMTLSDLDGHSSYLKAV